MVNIITKKGVSSQTPFSVSFENGSFIPSLSSEGLLSILDSQKLDIAYTHDGISSDCRVARDRAECLYL